MSEEAFLAAILASQGRDDGYLAFADWLDDHERSGIARRLRWWMRIRRRLAEVVRIVRPEVDMPEESDDFASPGMRLATMDDWRWRLASLKAIEGAELFYRPPMDGMPWPPGSSSERFLWSIGHARFLVEMVALGLYFEGTIEGLALARSHSDRARQLAAQLAEEAANRGMGDWVLACEIKKMAERTLALTTEWSTWVQYLPGEGGIAGELMIACRRAYDFILCEPAPPDT